MLYMPTQKMAPNQSRMTGANRMPRRLVPRRWKAYSSTSTAQLMPITASACMHAAPVSRQHAQALLEGCTARSSRVPHLRERAQQPKVLQDSGHRGRVCMPGRQDSKGEALAVCMRKDMRSVDVSVTEYWHGKCSLSSAVAQQVMPK